MFIAIVATEDQKAFFLQRQFPKDIQFKFLPAFTGADVNDIDAIFDFTPSDIAVWPKHIPIFKNAVLQLSKDLPANIIRMNAWPGFLNRSMMELVFDDSMAAPVEKIMQALQIKYLRVPDIIGLVAARSISMIINEAWFALADKVSSKEEIDIAMKLGTNYPYGPFEWGEIIGLQNIVALLKKLGEKDARYMPAPLLLQEITSS